MQQPTAWKTCRLLIVDASASLPAALRAELAEAPNIELLDATPKGAAPAGLTPDAALYVAPPNDLFLKPIHAWAACTQPLPFVILDPTPTMLRNSCVLLSGANGYVSAAVTLHELLGVIWFARQGGHAMLPAPTPRT